MSRIAQLPRRSWRDGADAAAAALTELLRQPGATAALRPIQAIGLAEAAHCGGLAAIARVGAGKTLLAALAMDALGAKRPLLLVPGGLKGKTERELAVYRREWRIPTFYRLLGYEDVSRMPMQGTSLQDLFGGLGPDALICDEFHRLRRVRDSAVARQVAHWKAQHPECPMVALSGTPDREGVADYAHVLAWCLGAGSPLPLDPDEIQDWAAVIDRGEMERARAVCLQLGIAPEADLSTIRAAYRRRLRETPGVIVSDDEFGGPLAVRDVVLTPPPELDEHFRVLRKLYQRPDGWDLSPDPPEEGQEVDRVQTASVWSVAREMALGFCYVPDPIPPRPWRDARRAYFAEVRHHLQRSDATYYTERQVRDAMERGELDAVALREWQAIEPTFEYQSKPLWLSDHAIEYCQEWGRGGPGVIWTEHRAFALRLAEVTGWSYFGEQGFNSSGRYIEDASPREVAIVSRRANSTGRNLQYLWSRCLFTGLPNTALDLTQAIGRLHRDGQRHPVHVDVLVACYEHWDSTQKVVAHAARTCESLMPQSVVSSAWVHATHLPEGSAFASK